MGGCADIIAFKDTVLVALAIESSLDKSEPNPS